MFLYNNFTRHFCNAQTLILWYIAFGKFDYPKAGKITSDVYEWAEEQIQEIEAKDHILLNK